MASLQVRVVVDVDVVSASDLLSAGTKAYESQAAQYVPLHRQEALSRLYATDPAAALCILLDTTLPDVLAALPGITLRGWHQEQVTSDPPERPGP